MLALKIKIIYSFQHLQRIWNEGQRKVAYFKLFYRIEYYSSSESGRKIWSKSEAFCLWTVAGFIFLNPDILGHSLTPSAQIAHYSNFCIERALSQAALVKLPWRNPICEKKKTRNLSTATETAVSNSHWMHERYFVCYLPLVQPWFGTLLITWSPHSFHLTPHQSNLSDALL